MKVLASYHLKGGVGRTAATVNLAYLMAQQGARTLVWDLDPQGATSFYFRVKPKVKGGVGGLLERRNAVRRSIRGTDYAGLDLLPADFSARHLDVALDHAGKPRRRLGAVLKQLRPDYDVVLIDCPPSIGLASESVFRAAHALLVPVIPTTLSINSLDQLAGHIRELRRAPEIWPFFSMVDARKSLHREVCASAPSLPYSFLDAHIPYSSHVERMGVRRAPLPAYAPTSAAARAYRALLDEVTRRIRGE